MTSGAAASAHPGQLTAVGPTGAPSPGNRRPRLEGPGRENLAAGSAVAGGKCEAYAAAPIGQDRPRSVAPAELPAAAGEAAFTGNALEEAAREGRKGRKGACAPGIGPHIVCPSKSEAPPPQRGSARRAQPPDARAWLPRGAPWRAGSLRQEVTCGAPQRANPDRLGLGGGRRGLGRSAGGSWSPGGRASGREQPPAEHL